MEQRISIERMEQAVNIFGSFDENIRLLEAIQQELSSSRIELSAREVSQKVQAATEMRLTPIYRHSSAAIWPKP